MKFKITQNQYNKFKNKIHQLDLFYDFVEVINYRNFGFGRYGRVFINLPDMSEHNTEINREKLFNKIKNCYCDVVLHNTLTKENFTVTSEDIKLTQNQKKLFITKEIYYEKILPNLPDITRYKHYINSTTIKNALEKAFKDNWEPRTVTYVAGVVGILPIPNSKRKWSIVNFFNTKKEIKDLIEMFLGVDYKNKEFKPNEDNLEESVILWMEKLFKNVNSDRMKTLINIQKKSIMKGFEDEVKYSKFISEVLHSGKKPKYSGYGTIRDIEEGIDFTIGGVTYQLKPFSTIIKEGDTIKVNVGYSNAPTYRTKFVNRIAFYNGKNLYVFENNGKKPKGKTYEFKIEEKKT